MYNACIKVSLCTMLVLVWVYVHCLYYSEFMCNACIDVSLCTMLVIVWVYVQCLYWCEFMYNACISYFIYFTTITKQVIQLIIIMLVGTDVCVRMIFVWEETIMPGGNPPVTTWPSHMPTPDIEPGSHQWEASA